jgi:hypothetical protein
MQPFYISQKKHYRLNNFIIFKIEKYVETDSREYDAYILFIF